MQNLSKKNDVSYITKMFFGVLIFLSVSSLVILNKDELIKFNIIINTFFILTYFLWTIIRNEKIQIDSVILTYSLFSLFCFFSVFWSVDQDNTIEMIIREVSIIASMIVLYNSVKNMGLYSYFYGAIFFFAILNFVLLVGGYFFDFIEIYQNNRFVGTMNNSNAISIALNYCVFISVILLNDTKNFRKILFLNFMIFISLYMIVMTVSRKGFLAGSLLFVLYLNSISNSKIKILSVLMSLVLIFYFSFSFLKFEEFETASDFLFDRMEGAADFEGQDVDASTEKRINLIESGWNMFLERPVLGWGINTFVVFHDGYYAHNNFIELLFGVGMIGAIMYYFIYLSLYKKAFYLLNGRERQYFIIIFTFFIFMDVILVSYYFRLYFMFVSFLLAYMKKNEGINS